MAIRTEGYSDTSLLKRMRIVNELIPLKLKLIVNVTRYVIYSNILPHMRAFSSTNMNTVVTLLIPDTIYSTLNKECLRFEP